MVAFSASAQAMRSSEIRRLMRLSADPSVISFAGGMPFNDAFPVSVVEELWRTLPTRQKQDAFQYCPTTGYPPLLEALSAYLRSRHLPVDSHRLCITTGAQQAIFCMARILLDPGDRVITEYPSFIGACAAFSSCGAHLSGAALDNEGICIDELSSLLEAGGEKTKLVYLTPNFHNPAGIIYSTNRRKQFLDIIRDTPLVVLEDDPYHELYFDESDRDMVQPITAHTGCDDAVCYSGSFSKILGPGMRLGWLLAPEGIMEKIELAKQSMDACSPTFSQVLACAFLHSDSFEHYLRDMRSVYSRKARLTLAALSAHMPANVAWTQPRGGFYIWVTMPEHIDASTVLNHALSHGAAFVIGKAFDPAGEKNNCFRLAFSNVADASIDPGIEIIADAVQTVMNGA